MEKPKTITTQDEIMGILKRKWGEIATDLIQSYEGQKIRKGELGMATLQFCQDENTGGINQLYESLSKPEQKKLDARIKKEINYY